MQIPNDPVVTYQELLKQNAYLQKIIQGQNIALDDMYRENTDLINTAVRMARENDLMFLEVQNSPDFHHYEHRV